MRLAWLYLNVVQTIAIGEVFHARSGYRRPQVDMYYLCDYRGGQFRANAEITEARFYALDALPTERDGNESARRKRTEEVRFERQ